MMLPVVIVCSLSLLIVTIGCIDPIYPCTVTGHLGSFQHWAVTNSATMTTLLPGLSTRVYAFLMGLYLGEGLLGHGCVCGSDWADTGKAILFQF